MEASQLPLKKEETVCQLCGSKDCENAFVFCIKCVKYAVHRYCLHVLPKTLTEFVHWYCEDCEETTGKLHPSKKPSPGPSLRSNGLPSESPEFDRILDGCPPSREKAKKLRKSRSKNKRIPDRLVNVVNEPEELKSQSGPSQEPCKGNNEKLVLEGGRISKASTDVAKINPDSQMVPAGPSNVSEDSYLQAHPVIDPIWSGSFNIETDGYGLCDGLVGHLSSKACKMACQEAGLFSKSLCMDLLPKTSVWPKSFQKSEPSDDSIALYFFASNDSCMKVFDGLVSEMISKELALKAVVSNAELLVFTSNELPISYWKFEGKFYLWGVFRKKQAPLFDSKNCQLMIQNVENDEHNITNKKELHATSPISPLSNISSSGYVSCSGL